MPPFGQSVILPNQYWHVWQSPRVCLSICPLLTVHVVSELQQPLPWTVWTAVTGEEVKIREHETPADTAWLVNVVFPLRTIIGSGKVLSFLIVAIRSIRFLKALSGPAKVFLDVHRCTCWHEQKKSHKNVQCMPTELCHAQHCMLILKHTIKAHVCKDFHSHTHSTFCLCTPLHMHTQTIRSPWKEGWDLKRHNQVWQSTAPLKQALLQPNTAVIVNVRQN